MMVGTDAGLLLRSSRDWAGALKKMTG